MKMKSALVVLAFVTMGYGASLAPAMAAGNIYDTLKADPQFSTLVKIIDATHTRHNYVGGTRTVFAPTNEAFDKIKGGYDDMLGETDRVNTQALLMYEILPGEHTPESFKGKKVTIRTLQKDDVTIDGTGEKLHFGDAYGADQSGDPIKASNGIIIPVDTLPVPEFSQSNDVPVPAPHEGMAPAS
ncbi:MAG: fasciclin domain-containing protein [Parvibaculum sp.]